MQTNYYIFIIYYMIILTTSTDAQTFKQTDYNVFDVHSGDYTTENSYDNDFVIL